MDRRSHCIRNGARRTPEQEEPRTSHLAWSEIAVQAAACRGVLQRRLGRDFGRACGAANHHASIWLESGDAERTAITVESGAATDDGRNELQEFHDDANRFASPPLAVLATGDARVATIESLRQCFMLHSVVHAVSAEMLKNVLLEAAELRKLKPHPGLLRLCAVVTDQPWGEVGLLSELTTGSLATLLDTSPIHLTWANGLLALATDVAEGLAHLHGLGL